MVWQILEMLAAGENSKEIIKGFPSLRPEHIRAALEYASSLTKDHFVVIDTAPEHVSIPAR